MSKKSEAKREAEAHKCQTEFDSLKRNIISYLEVQRATALPLTLLDDVAAHNEHCTNSIIPEEAIRQEKADADTKNVQRMKLRQKRNCETNVWRGWKKRSLTHLTIKINDEVGVRCVRAVW